MSRLSYIAATDPLRAVVHAPAHMAQAIGVAVAPGFHVFAEMQRIDAVALDRGDEVVLDGEVDLAGQIGLERQVHVADAHHDPAVHRILAGEGKAQAARPMRHRARRGAKPRRAAAGRAAQIDRQIGAERRGDPHFACFAQHLDAQLHLRPIFGLRFGPLEDFGMFVGDDQQPRAGRPPRSRAIPARGSAPRPCSRR
jgi:hypothetical protein